MKLVFVVEGLKGEDEELAEDQLLLIRDVFIKVVELAGSLYHSSIISNKSGEIHSFLEQKLEIGDSLITVKGEDFLWKDEAWNSEIYKFAGDEPEGKIIGVVYNDFGYDHIAYTPDKRLIFEDTGSDVWWTDNVRYDTEAEAVAKLQESFKHEVTPEREWADYARLTYRAEVE